MDEEIDMRNQGSKYFLNGFAMLNFRISIQ